MSKSNMMFVKPVANMVRDPDSDMKPIKKTGQWVPRKQYWFNRLRDKDVVQVKAPTAAPASTTENKPAETSTGNNVTKLERSGDKKKKRSSGNANKGNGADKS